MCLKRYASIQHHDIQGWKITCQTGLLSLERVLEVELHVTPAIPDELLQEILPIL